MPKNDWDRNISKLIKGDDRSAAEEKARRSARMDYEAAVAGIKAEIPIVLRLLNEPVIKRALEERGYPFMGPVAVRRTLRVPILNTELFELRPELRAGWQIESHDVDGSEGDRTIHLTSATYLLSDGRLARGMRDRSLGGGRTVTEVQEVSYDDLERDEESYQRGYTNVARATTLHSGLTRLHASLEAMGQDQ